MIVSLHTRGLKSLSQIRQFLDGSLALEIEFDDRKACYEWLEGELGRFRYRTLKRAEKGLLKAYLEKVSGRSRAQITRLIRQFGDSGRIRDRRGPPASPFLRHYSDDDIRALAEIDRLHGTLSGPATRKLCERACRLFGDQRYERLASISNGHLYNLRRSRIYRRKRGQQHHTEPVRRELIGERRKPRPDGEPGFLRVDTVHQGDRDGVKGLYHVNVIDEVTQMQFIGSVETICERDMIPMLEALILSFPFRIQGFHTDNGSEYINHKVVALLSRLHVGQFTRSRARRSNDNALVESKNGSVIRRHLGYSHIPSCFAGDVNTFLRDHLVPYLNFHHPCYFPSTVVDAKGRERKHYRYEHLMTPYDKLRSLPDAGRFLKSGLDFEQLDEIAFRISDNEAAGRMKTAQSALFQRLFQPHDSVA